MFIKWWLWLFNAFYCQDIMFMSDQIKLDSIRFYFIVHVDLYKNEL